MNIKLTFFGAARNVTGSSYLVEANGRRILVDCGFYQERDLKHRNWDPFPVPARTIDAVLLTHAHLDHCGRLPKLVKEGFKGTIFCTPATADIAQIILRDSAKIQEEDASNKRRRHKKEHRKTQHPEEPLYRSADVAATLPLFSCVEYDKPVPLGEGLSASFLEAGHILGSTSIKLFVKNNNEERTILFSGDIGRWDIPILKDPNTTNGADYILVESTYGDRVHGKIEDISETLASIVNETHKEGGNVVIPSFAVERSQEIIYYLNGRLAENKIPKLKTFLDSPMAVKVTDVFKRHAQLFDKEAMDLLHAGKHPCDFPGLTLTRSVQQSKSIKQVKGSAIIISASGMCTGGRVKHHLVNNISRSESTILFVGYQANGTLGRAIVNGCARVRILGQYYPVRAKVEKMGGFSAHADKNELLKWLSSIKKAPRQVFVVHGEEKPATHFAGFLKEKTGWKTMVPEYKQEVILS